LTKKRADKAAADKATRDAAAFEIEKAYAEKDLALLKTSNQTELEQVDSLHDIELKKYSDYRDQKLLTNEQFNNAERELQLSLEADKLDIEKKAQNDARELQYLQLSTAEEIFSGLGQLATIFGDKHSKEAQAAFAVSKAASIAQATIKTYDAATGAYSSMASIPYVGPALGVAAAAAAVGAGLANVAMIKSQSFSGRLQGGDMQAGEPYMLGEAGRELVVPKKDMHAFSAPRTRQIESMQNQTSTTTSPINLQIHNNLGINDHITSYFNSPIGVQTIQNMMAENNESFSTILRSVS
jgi:hypothetical protein